MNDGIKVKSNFFPASRSFFLEAKLTPKKMSKALAKVAFKVLADAKKRTPVLTGALRASGRVRTLNQFRAVVEFGGRGTGVDYAQAVEFGTFRTPPKPFLRPALYKNKKLISKTLKRSGQNQFNAIVRRIPRGI